MESSTSISVTVLGATGTIGLNTLDIISQHADRYTVHALTANHNVDGMFKLCLKYQPSIAVMTDEVAADALSARLKAADIHTDVQAGVDALCRVARADSVDVVMAAIVGAAGLLPALAAAEAGKRVLLANKEALVMSGQLFIDAVKENGATLLPIDSEHNAIFQCLPSSYAHEGASASGVNKILLTASGGPFRGFNQQQLAGVTVEQAVSHPNWVMGRKISIDSASLMNKGLEVIEACWLFDVSVDMIDVVVHPQSVIHSMASYKDGSVLAQMGNPDMRTPIAHALAWPERISAGVEALDLHEVAQLTFERPDKENFPCLQLAFDAIRTGGTASAILNAANEIAVEAFLQREIAFVEIPKVVEFALENADIVEATSLDVIYQADHAARELAKQYVGRLTC